MGSRTIGPYFTPILIEFMEISAIQIDCVGCKVVCNCCDVDNSLISDVLVIRVIRLQSSGISSYSTTKPSFREHHHNLYLSLGR